MDAVCPRRVRPGCPRPCPLAVRKQVTDSPCPRPIRGRSRGRGMSAMMVSRQSAGRPPPCPQNIRAKSTTLDAPCPHTVRDTGLSMTTGWLPNVRMAATPCPHDLCPRLIPSSHARRSWNLPRPGRSDSGNYPPRRISSPSCGKNVPRIDPSPTCSHGMACRSAKLPWPHSAM